MSHTISVKECQESGRSELAWDTDNIQLRCEHCDPVHESLSKEKREQKYWLTKMMRDSENLGLYDLE